MPSCCIVFHTLRRNSRLHAHASRVLQWQLHHYSSSTSGIASHRDDTARTPAVNLNTVTAESAYLDFLLGSEEHESAARRVSSNEHILSGTHEHLPQEQEPVPFPAQVADKQRLTKLVRRVENRRQPLQRESKVPRANSQSSKGRLEALQQRVESHHSKLSPFRAEPGLSSHVNQEEGTAGHSASRQNVRGEHTIRVEPIRPQLPQGAHSTRRQNVRGEHTIREEPIRPQLPQRALSARLTMRYGSHQPARTPSFFVRNTVLRKWVKHVELLYSHISERGQFSSILHQHPDPPTFSPISFDLVDEVYQRLASHSDLNSLFLKHPGQWSQVLLWFLHYDRIHALDFLLALHSRFRLQSPKRCAEAIRCLANEYWYSDDVASLKRLAESFLVLTRDGNATSQVYTHEFVYRALIDHFSDETLSAVYGDLKKMHHRSVHWTVWLTFATTFSRRQRGDQSLDALLESRHAGAYADDVLFRRVCETIVRKTVGLPGGLRACIRIVDAMFKIGVTLDNKLANIIMLNAVEAGDIKTAMDIYNSLRDHGLQPDQYTFAILLKACKLSIDNVEMLNSTIRAAIDGINVLQDPVVATEILHCLALHHTRSKNRAQVFEIVADAYAQLFTIEPLRLVGLLPAKLSHDRHRDVDRHRPRPQDIYIVLSTFLEQSFSHDKSVVLAYKTWQRFKYAIEAGEEPFASMLQTDHIFNAFLSTFTKTNKGMLHAAEVVKYMQLPDEADARYQRTRPTVQTWSIFLHGFMRHGLLSLAEQVLTYMQSQGIQPNIVTYNSLLSGYVATRDTEGVLNSIRRIERDGLTWDDYSRKYLDMAKAKAVIEPGMEQNIAWPTLDFTADLKDNLEKRIEAFASSVQLRGEQEHDDADEERRTEAEPRAISEHQSRQEKSLEAYFDDGAQEDAGT